MKKKDKNGRGREWSEKGMEKGRQDGKRDVTQIFGDTLW